MYDPRSLFRLMITMLVFRKIGMHDIYYDTLKLDGRIGRRGLCYRYGKGDVLVWGVCLDGYCAEKGLF